MPGAPDQAAQAWVATGLILFVVLILSFGGTIERMLEYFAWTMLAVVFLFLLAINIAFVPMSHWLQTFLGFFSFTGLPQPIDWGLIGALAATAGSGGIGNLTVTNWIRDKGFGMGAKVGAIPSAVGGHAIQLTHVGTVFPATPDEPGALARVDEIRPRGSALGVGALLFPRDVPQRQPGDRHHPARHRPAGARGGRVSGRVPQQDLAGVLVPDALQRLLDSVQDAARQHRHPGADDHRRRLDVEQARARLADGDSRDLLRHPGRRSRSGASS